MRLFRLFVAVHLGCCIQAFSVGSILSSASLPTPTQLLQTVLFFSHALGDISFTGNSRADGAPGV